MLKLFAGLVVAVVIFRGTLSVLPEFITRDRDGSLTGFGFWIPMVTTIVVMALVYDKMFDRSRADNESPD